jgi:hypothetical protein
VISQLASQARALGTSRALPLARHVLIACYLPIILNSPPCHDTPTRSFARGLPNLLPIFKKHQSQHRMIFNYWVCSYLFRNSSSGENLSFIINHPAVQDAYESVNNSLSISSLSLTFSFLTSVMITPPCNTFLLNEGCKCLKWPKGHSTIL